MSKKNTKVKRIFALLMAVLIAVTYVPNPLYAYAEDYLDDDQVTAPSDEYVEETPQDGKTITLDGDLAIRDDSVRKALIETKAEAAAEDADAPVSDDTAVDTETDDTKEPSGETSEGTVEDGREPLDDKVDLTEVTTDTESQVVTKETETEADAESISYPSHFFKEEAGGVKVAVSAPEGALPEGTTMEVTPILAEDVEEAVSEAVSDKVKSINAVDITFKNAEGQEIEPLIPVSVTLNVPGMNRKATKEIVHIDDEGTATTVDYLPVANTGASLFESDQFSVYVVVETGEDARLEVVFVKADGTTASQLITQNQLSHINQYIYDPGAGTLPDGTMFEGWTDVENYDTTTTKMTIANVREAVATRLQSAVTEGDQMKFYAMVFKPYTVTFLDERGIMVKTDQILVRANESAPEYTVSESYTPYPTGEAGVVAEFMGWQQIDPVVPGTMVLYQNGESFNMTANSYTLKAQTQKGHWLIFEENLNNAPYTQPQFIPIGGHGTAVTGLTRTGYTFDGWWTEDASSDRDGQVSGTRFDFNTVLTENTKVYAKWDKATKADYNVVIWQQNKEGTGYDYSGTTITVSNATVGENTYAITAQGSDNSRYARVKTGPNNNNYQDVRFTGFHLSTAMPTNATTKGFDNPTAVAAEGNTVINVYYDRNEITYIFSGSSNWEYKTISGYQLAKSGSGGGSSYYIKVNGNWYRFSNYGNDAWNASSITSINMNNGRVDFIRNGSSDYAYINTTPTTTSITEPQSFTGLYGSDFTQWPDPGTGHVWQAPSGMLLPLPLTEFNPLAVDESYTNVYSVTFTLTDYSSNRTLYVYKQTETGQWSYTSNYLIATAPLNGYNGAKWYPTETYIGYTIQGYQVGGTNGTWTPCTNSSEITFNNNNLYIRYSRNQYDIVYNDGVFVSGSEEATVEGITARTNFDHVDDVYYEADISGATYNKTPEYDGFVFLGWYDNALCAGEPFTFDKMPAHNVSLYAKWGLNEYEINLHPNDSTSDPIKYNNLDQVATFYADEGDNIGNVGGERIYYDLVGWYTDAEFTHAFDFEAIRVNKTNIANYGKLYTADEIDPRYPTTIGELNLYAKWRSKLIGAEGIKVEYDLNGGTGTAVDNNYYVDGAQALAQPAVAAGNPNEYVFSHWEVQKWNGSAYVPSGVNVFPGATFDVFAADAKITDQNGNPVAPTALDSTKQYTYTVQLKAIYVEKDKEVKTHIYWYNNYDGGLVWQNNDIKINEAVDIPAAPTRDGYVFKGWIRGIEEDGPTTTLTDLWLVWDGTNYTYNGNAATQVAADENLVGDGTQHHALYAKWEPIHYTVHFEKNSDEATGTMEDQSFAYDEEKALTANAFSREHYTFTGWNTAADGSGTGYTDAHVVKNLTTTDGAVVTLYAQWTLNQYPYTIHHYLKGTTTQVKADDTGNADFGSTVTATPATEYQGVALTVDSYVQSQTITIAEEGNVITVYYTIPLTVRAKTDSKVYDGQPLYGGYTVEGALPNDVTAINAKLAVAAVNTHITNVAESVLIYALLPSVITNDYPYYTIYNYEGTLTINPRPVTVTAKSENFTYDGNAHSNQGYDVEGLVGNDAISAVVTGSITFPSESPVTNEVTSYEFTSGTAGNYDVTTVNGQLTMTSASVAITITAASDEWTYDGNAHSNNEVTVTSGQLLNGDTLVATATGSVTNVADTATGNNPIAEGYKIMHGDQDVTANYAITTQAGTLTINPKAVTVTAKSEEFTYDGNAHSNSGYDVVGLVGEDAISAVVTGSITFPSQSPVTNVLASYEFTTGTPGNYTVTTANGQLTMTTASVAITIKAADDSKTYDGTPLTNSTVTVTEGTLLTGDELVATATGSATNVADTATGNNPIAAGYKIMHGTEDVTENYVITTEAGTLTINPKAVTVTAQSKAFVYTGAAQSWPQYDVDGLVGDDAISAVVTGSITFPSESPVTNELTSYEFTVGTPGNYTVTTANGQLTMTNAEAAITITAASDEWTYDGNAHQNTEVTVTSGELLPGDELVATATGSVTNVADTATGNNPIAEGYKIMHGDQDVTANYAITTQAGTLTINPKAVTVTAKSEEFTYDGNAHSNSGYDVVGLVGEDAISAVVTGSITFPSQSPVTNTVASYEFTTGTPDNYTVTTANGQLTMTAASVEITITAASDEWTYDGAAHQNTTVTVTEGTLLTGDELVATATGSATNVADTATGNNPIAAGYKIMHGTEDVTENYVITTQAGTLTINPKAVTVTAQDKAFAYTGEAQSWPQYDVVGLVGDDAISAVVTGSITFPSESPVTNELTSYEFTSGTPGNYTVSTVNGQLTMTAASVAITITAASDEWTYDGSAHQNTEVTVTSGELLPGDELVATATGSVTNVSDTETGNNPIAAGYKIMHGTEDVTANYVITPVAGTLTINPKTVTITARDADKPYDATPLTQPLFDVTDLEAGDEHVFTVVMTDDSTITDVGTQPNVIATVDGVAVTTGEPTAVGNYLVTTAQGTLTITQDEAEFVIKSADHTWTYDSKLHKDETYTVTYKGTEVAAGTDGKTFTLPNGDVLTITATAAGVTNVSDNAADNNTFTYVVKRGDVVTTGNYKNVVINIGDLVIAPKEVTITANDAEKPYDGTPLTQPLFTASPLEEGDEHVFAVTMTADSTITDVGTQPNVIATVDGVAVTTGQQTAIGNYLVTTVNGTLEITKDQAEIVISSASNEWTYDGENHTDETYTVTYNGEVIEPEEDGVTFILPNGDVIVITPTAEGVTDVADNAEDNNTFTYTVMRGDVDTSGNYENLTADPGTLIIDPKPVTVIADDKTKVYGTADPELTATEDGVVEGDTLEYELYRDRGENVGSYNISFTYPTDNEPQPSGWLQKLFRAFEPQTQTVVQGNYEIKFVDGEFDITPMPLTITAASDEKVYDGTPLTNSNYTATALAEGDTLTSVTVTGSQTEVGSSPNTPSDAKITNAAGEDMTGNYDITYVKGALVVTPAPVNPPKPPKTGDDNHPWGWAGLAGLAMAGLAVLFATRKREEESR